MTPLSLSKKICLALVSFALVAFGQPAWVSWMGLLAGVCGYALFWRVTVDYSNPWRRFLLGTAWFALAEMVHLSWFLAHPYLYIYAIYFVFSVGVGAQFGLLCVLVKPTHLGNIRRLIAFAALWTLMEWSRLFFLAGYTWNPAGLALTGSLYPLQMASLWGIYGLTFWVIFTNLLALRAWSLKRWEPALVWAMAAALPYLYGGVHLQIHDSAMTSHSHTPYHAVMVQTAFPIEEVAGFPGGDWVTGVMGEWRQILSITKKQLGKENDLIVLPEFVVPFGTYTFVFPYEKVRAIFEEELGEEAASNLPPLELPLAYEAKTENGKEWMVNNAFFAQGMANIFHADLVAGLEDVEDTPEGVRHHYSAAMRFRADATYPYAADRYAKRVLVPMGEYIPFSFCRDLAAHYGVCGSFTHGEEALVIADSKIPYGLSICYEETFGDIMRENRQQGAQMLVNLTSDAWYPHSRLPQQHFDHARLRTVENGFPLVRACNTGITGVIDSLGRVVMVLGETPEESEDLSDSLRVEVPSYHYQTPYSRFGDGLIIGFSLLAVALFFRLKIGNKS